MSPEEALVAADVYDAIQRHSNTSERSQQVQVGVSDLGFCSERVKRQIAGEVAPERDVTAAFIGTALGRETEEALAKVWPDAILQAEVTLRLQGETRTYEIPGHPDIIRPHGLLIDVKTTRGLTVVKRTGPSQSQQFQRHGYALAAHEAGLFDVPLEQVQVANVWLDRAGDDTEPHVQMEPFNPEVVEEAARWLDEVVYAYEHGLDARKEPPREMCAKVCGFYETCRLYDTDVEGLLTDPKVVTAVQMYLEGGDLERQGAKLKDQAKGNLLGITGATGDAMVRWVHISERDVPARVQGAYDRLDVRRRK